MRVAVVAGKIPRLTPLVTMAVGEGPEDEGGTAQSNNRMPKPKSRLSDAIRTRKK